MVYISAISIVLILTLLALAKGWVLWEPKDIGKGFISILTVAFPVAVVEELTFRMVPIVFFGFTPGTIIISSLLFAIVHFFWGMYSGLEDAKEAVCLFFGLALLGFGCCYLYHAQWYYGILFHAGCISGVSVSQQFVSSSNNILYHPGHKLIRSPLAWVLMTIVFIYWGVS